MKLDMERRLLVLGFITAGLLAVSGMTTAEASPASCEHRSEAHLAEHGGRQADNAWHVSRGELPACDQEQETGDRKRDDRDDHHIPHRDRIGPSWRELFR